MEEEIPLAGGRMTPGVVRKGGFVYRPTCANSPFVHEVLTFLEANGLPYAPRFRGTDDRGREILTFIEGTTPGDLGGFSLEQCRRAAGIIRALHRCLRGLPGCPPGRTVCHNDLSPCNFRFSGGAPAAVIDWDAAAFGDPLDDLAYAVWMWLDIGNDAIGPAFIREGTAAMLDAYGVPAAGRRGFGPRILGQMERVGKGTFPTGEQTKATRAWVAHCRAQLEGYLKNPAQRHPRPDARGRS